MHRHLDNLQKTWYIYDKDGDIMEKIAVFLFDNMTDYEITFITHLLRVDAGKEVVTVSYEDKVIKSASGVSYRAEQLVKDVLKEDLDGLILCGGWFGEIRSELIQLIQVLNAQHKLLAGICGAGTFFLASAGVLDSVSYTTPITRWTDQHIRVFGQTDPFPKETYVPARVVVDGNIITALGTAFLDFAIEICDWFGLFSTPEEKRSFSELYKG